MVTFGDRSVDGSLPMPGRINRVGRNQGIGAHNYKKDSSGHLYSALIAQEYLDSKVVISPGERSPVVSEFGSWESDEAKSYDYSSYNPPGDRYWMGDQSDPPGSNVIGGPNQVFQTKINRTAMSNGRGHASYAHLMLAGQRRLDWNVKASSDRVLLGTRGPSNGSVTGNPYRRSRTLLFFGDPEVWVGNVVRGDGRVERLEQREIEVPTTAPTFGFRDLVFQCGDERPLPDNIFHAEHQRCGDADGNWKQGDAWIGMNELVTHDHTDTWGQYKNPKPLSISDYLTN